MQTTEAVSNPIQAVTAGTTQVVSKGNLRETRERANTDTFGAVFAQLAQFASLDASRNGKLTLGVGQQNLSQRNTTAGGQPRLSDVTSPTSKSATADDGLTGLTEAGKRSRSLAEAQRNLGSVRTTSHHAELAARQPSASAEPTQGADDKPTPVRDSVNGSAVSTETKSGTADNSSAATVTPAAAISADSAGTRARGTGQSTAFAAVAAAGKVGAPGGGATTATNATAVALGGRVTGLQANPTPGKAAPNRATTGGSRTATAFRAQLAQGLGAALRQGSGEVSLKLTPKALGELRISLRVHEGVVDAHLKPSTTEARGLLEQSVETLRHAMEARGLKIGKLEIEHPPVSKDGTPAQSQASPGGQEGHAGMSGEQGRDHPAEPGESQRGRGDGSPRVAEEEGQERGAESPDTLAAGGPGVVYGVADGAARLVMVDALA